MNRPIVTVVFGIIIVFVSAVESKLRSFEFASVKLFPDISGHGIKAHIDTQSKHFDVNLEAHPELFAKDFVVDDGTREYGRGDVVSYSGNVVGHYNSEAICSVANSRFEGMLLLNNGTSEVFYLEDGTMLSEVNCHDDPFYGPTDPQHCTVGYFSRDDDLVGHSHGDRRAKRAVDNEIEEPDGHSFGMCGWNNPKIAASLNKMNPTPMEYSEVPKPRRRRAADTKPKVCSLFMQVDHTTWSQYMTEHNDDQRARIAVTRMVADIVSGASTIFRLQDFYTDDRTVDSMTGFSFQINRIRIFKKEEVCASNHAVIKQLCPDFIDSDAFLKINSELDHSESCLAYFVSHRAFTGGVMGLAWLGYPSGYVGGVCQKPTKGAGGKSTYYNTGIITSNNQGSKASKRSLMLTLAHEVGHNFGSPHDSSSDCIPSGREGYYLMYPYVNPGDMKNNDKFSDCSRNKIALNLDAILRGRKSNCFAETLAPFCGNQVIEGSEQCDCGLTQQECEAVGDTCCNPADSPNGCKLKSGKKCSPSQGPCCDAPSCDYVAGIVCQKASECAGEAKCNGGQPTCPQPPPLANYTPCASNTRRCVNGECSQSICEEIKYESCQQPMPKEGFSADYCYLSCKSRESGNQPCVNSLNSEADPKMKELLDLVNNGKPLHLPPGSPCDEFRGVCDPFQRCRRVNTQGPLAKMFLALTGQSAVDSAGAWLVRYWWVVAICAVVFIAISFCLLKFCSDLLPTSNPKLEGRLTAKQAIHTMTTTVRRRHGAQHQRVPTNPPPF